MLLKRALRNLADNAVAYGVRARLSVRVEDDAARIAVSDDGPGLTEVQIRTLIEPFARGGPSRNRATGGAGLAVSNARDLPEGEGGSLTLSVRKRTRLNSRHSCAGSTTYSHTKTKTPTIRQIAQ